MALYLESWFEDCLGLLLSIMECCNGDVPFWIETQIPNIPSLIFDSRWFLCC